MKKQSLYRFTKTLDPVEKWEKLIDGEGWIVCSKPSCNLVPMGDYVHKLSYDEIEYYVG